MNIYGNKYDMDILELFFPRNSRSDAALSVIKGGAQRVEALYYPYSQAGQSLFLYGAAPGLYKYLLRSLLAQ